MAIGLSWISSRELSAWWVLFQVRAKEREDAIDKASGTVHHGRPGDDDEDYDAEPDSEGE